jgi:hypothetical protein
VRDVPHDGNGGSAVAPALHGGAGRVSQGEPRGRGAGLQRGREGVSILRLCGGVFMQRGVICRFQYAVSIVSFITFIVSSVRLPLSMCKGSIVIDVFNRPPLAREPVSLAPTKQAGCVVFSLSHIFLQVSHIYVSTKVVVLILGVFDAHLRNGERRLALGQCRRARDRGHAVPPRRAVAVQYKLTRLKTQIL